MSHAVHAKAHELLPLSKLVEMFSSADAALRL